MLKKNKKIIAIISAVVLVIGLGSGVAYIRGLQNKVEKPITVAEPEKNLEFQSTEAVEKEAEPEKVVEKKEEVKVDTTEKQTDSKVPPRLKEIKEPPSKIGKIPGGSDYLKTLNAINSVLDDKYILNGSTLEMKSKVGAEYELWDGYLNEIYKVIMSNLSDKEKQELIVNETLWVKDKERIATIAGDEFKGGTAETLAYGISAARTTRYRCYELVNLYMDGK